jgi:hypothetical protein
MSSTSHETSRFFRSSNSATIKASLEIKGVICIGYNLQRLKNPCQSTKSDNHQCSRARSCPSPTSKTQNLDLVGAMSLSESDSLASSSLSSSDDANQRHAASRPLISNRGGTLQKSSDDIDFLAAKFAATKLSPSRTFLCSSDG